MSAGVDSGPAALRRAGLPARVPLVLAVLLVLAAIAYPLSDGGARDAVSWTIVLLGSGVSVTAAAAAHGARTGAAVLALVVVTAVVFESVGLATGFPYGEYTYSDVLGPTLLGVPFLVPLAWLMMAWPSRVLAGLLTRRVREGRRRAARVAVAAAVFAGWDVVLDPQLVQAGYWTWAHPAPGLPGIDTVPLTNLAGWLLAGLVLMALLEVAVARTAVPGGPPVTAAPLLVIAWMVPGGALAHALWLDLPGSAAWGAALSAGVLAVLALQARRR
ncbi:putative membrane protein [Geodermatophilus saharensis]|uniref:Putative membrane protein n=1 Tax=Geodermatophilus saharensis TaxID=1137994 RepID=A0A239BJ69_9ACTN|nr:carotenoid biosynthesis protein [Geodermatophilus saharensis]SNS07103.1 putative membrane protein [Geodermatophilus saharensis]